MKGTIFGIRFGSYTTRSASGLDAMVTKREESRMFLWFWLEHLGKSRRGTGFGSREVVRGGQEFSFGLVELRCLLVIQVEV